MEHEEEQGGKASSSSEREEQAGVRINAPDNTRGARCLASWCAGAGWRANNSLVVAATNNNNKAKEDDARSVASDNTRYTTPRDEEEEEEEVVDDKDLIAKVSQHPGGAASPMADNGTELPLAVWWSSTGAGDGGAAGLRAAGGGAAGRQAIQGTIPTYHLHTAISRTVTHHGWGPPSGLFGRPRAESVTHSNLLLVLPVCCARQGDADYYSDDASFCSEGPSDDFDPTADLPGPRVSHPLAHSSLSSHSNRRPACPCACRCRALRWQSSPPGQSPALPPPPGTAGPAQGRQPAVRLRRRH